MLAVLITVLPVLPASALNTSDDFQYEVLSEQDKICALVSYQGFDAVLEIPTQIDGYTVITIRGGCFSGFASYMLEELTIPDSVTTLDDGALQSCFSLKSVRLPENLEKIGAHVFESCTAMETIDIPASVTSIGDYAFYNCTSLSEFTFPEHLTSIGAYAFYNCVSLVNLVVRTALPQSEIMHSATVRGCKILRFPKILLQSRIICLQVAEICCRCKSPKGCTQSVRLLSMSAVRWKVLHFRQPLPKSE